jgi:hypothetical protein
MGGWGIDSSGSGQGPLMDYCECYSEYSCSMKGVEFLDMYGVFHVTVCEEQSKQQFRICNR